MTAFPLATPSLRTVRNAAAKLPPASAYIFAVAAGNGFSLLTIPLMAHRLSPASFGELDVAVSVVEFIGLFMTLGIAETCIRFSQESGTAGPETQSMPAAILGAAAALALLLGCAIQLFLGRIAGAIGITADPIALRVAVAGSCATALIEMPLIWLRLRGRPWRYLTFVSARAAVQAAATVTVLLAGGGAAGLLLSNGLLMLGFAGALSVFQIRETGIRFALAPFPLIARYGFPLVGGLLAMFALGNCDRWFLSGRVPSAEIAYYGLAAKLALVTAVVYQPFLLWWSARRLSMLWEKDGPAKLGKAWGHGTGLLTLSALIVALAAPSFISAVFPDSYRKAIDYLPLLVLISVLNELCSLSNTGVYATDHGFRALAVNGIGAAAAMAGYAILIPAQGVMGAIEATVLAHLVRLALFLWFGRKAAPVAYPWGAAAVAVSLATASVVLAPPASSLLLRGVWLAASAVLLGTALVAMRLFPLPAFLVLRLPGFAERHLTRQG